MGIFFLSLYEAPGFFVGLTFSIFEIDAFVLPPDRFSTFGSIDPAYCKSIPRDAVVAKKVFPKVCRILDDFSIGFVPVRAN